MDGCPAHRYRGRCICWRDSVPKPLMPPGENVPAPVNRASNCQAEISARRNAQGANPAPYTQSPCRRCPAFQGLDNVRRFAQSSTQSAFNELHLKRLIVRVDSAQCVAGVSPVGLGRLRRTYNRQHSCSFAVGIRRRCCFLFQNDVLVTNRADHGAVSFTVLLQKAIESHHAAAAHWNPNFLRTFWAHTPLSPCRLAKYIPEPRRQRILISPPRRAEAWQKGLRDLGF